MKLILYTYCLLMIVFSSCNTEELTFEKEFYWQGHWERLDTPNEYFSSGYSNSVAQFCFSTIDTIKSTLNPYKLVDFNYRKKWKIFQTNAGQYLKISELEADKIIEIFGPSDLENELESGGVIYVLKKGFVHPLIPDSLIYGK